MSFIRNLIRNLAIKILLRDVDLKNIPLIPEKDRMEFLAQLHRDKRWQGIMKALIANDVQRNLYVYDIYRSAFIRGELYRSLKLLNLTQRAYKQQKKVEESENSNNESKKI